MYVEYMCMPTCPPHCAEEKYLIDKTKMKRKQRDEKFIYELRISSKK